MVYSHLRSPSATFGGQALSAFARLSGRASPRACRLATFGVASLPECGFASVSGRRTQYSVVIRVVARKGRRARPGEDRTRERSLNRRACGLHRSEERRVGKEGRSWGATG